MSPDRETIYNRNSELMFAEFGLLEPIIEPMYREKPVGEDERPPITRFEGYAYASMKHFFESRKEKLG